LVSRQIVCADRDGRFAVAAKFSFCSFAEVQKALNFVRAKLGDRCRFEDATESGIMGDTYQETEELLDYEEEEDAAPNGVGAKAAGDAVKK
jgi:hypothetical protein